MSNLNLMVNSTIALQLPWIIISRSLENGESHDTSTLVASNCGWINFRIVFRLKLSAFLVLVTWFKNDSATSFDALDDVKISMWNSRWKSFFLNESYEGTGCIALSLNRKDMSQNASRCAKVNLVCVKEVWIVPENQRRAILTHVSPRITSVCKWKITWHSTKQTIYIRFQKQLRCIVNDERTVSNFENPILILRICSKLWTVLSHFLNKL